MRSNNNEGCLVTKSSYISIPQCHLCRRTMLNPLRTKAKASTVSQQVTLFGRSEVRRSNRDDHYPGCQLDIRLDSEFATGYGYPKTAFKWEPDRDPDIRNTFIDVSRIQTFGKSYTLHDQSFIIFRSIFSAFCAMTPSLYLV